MAATAEILLADRYLLLREIGRGATGTVYLARDTRIGRLVALKTFPMGREGRREVHRLRRRLLREAQSAGILDHPSIVTIYDVVEDEATGTFFIAMEYVEGKSLEEVLRHCAPLPLAVACHLVNRIAGALDHLHSQGMVHRDIKPANILLTRNGGLKLTDFGIALLVHRPGQTLELELQGTPYYMAPEQILGRRVDHRADIFALGVILHEMLTGRKPFEGENWAAVLHAIAQGTFGVLNERDEGDEGADGLPAEVRQVLQRALAREPEERFPSAGELAAELARAVAQVAVDSEAESPARGVGVLAESADSWEGWPASWWESAEEGHELDVAAHPTVPWPVLGRDGVRGSPGSLPGRLTPRRLALEVLGTTAGCLLVATLVGWGITGNPWPWSSGRDPSWPSPDYLSLVAQARQLGEAGDLLGATVLFEVAERLAPERREQIQVFRRRLEERLARPKEDEDGAVAARVEEARRALARGRYEEVLAVARSLLEEEGGRDEALAVLTAVEEALLRGRANRAAPETTGPALLEVQLVSQAPAGVVTLYAGKDQILLEPFRFPRRAGLFRSPSARGELRWEREIPPGKTTLRVYVTVRNQPAEMVRLDGVLRSGRRQRLVISVAEEGSIQARLD